MTAPAQHAPMGREWSHHPCPALRSARVLVRRLTGLLLEMRSPDGQHRALRSAYSRRGVCEVYRGHEHSPLCSEMFAALNASADWWDAYGDPEAVQPALFADEVAV